MDNQNIIALIVEGAAEQAIMEVLLDNNKLKFTREDILQEKVIRTRNAKSFAKQYLGMEFSKPIKIYRILDSKRENFNLPRAYQRKIQMPVENYYTRPEIEILYIIYHGDYDKYVKKFKSNPKYKPSSYAKTEYHDLNNIKNREENYDFWNTHIHDLIHVLKQYKSYHSNESSIADLLK